MAELNISRFEFLLNYVHEHSEGTYCLYDNEGQFIEAVYDTDYESDNGMDEDEDGYEEFQCILFRRISDGSLFEVNYHKIPVKVIFNGNVLYE
jgi:hypothetical protein